MMSMIGILVLSLIVMTGLFMIIENHEYIENIKTTLKLNNQTVINAMKREGYKDRPQAFKDYFNNTNMRGTCINKYGRVISDSEEYGKELPNHNGRKEIVDARKYGEGYDIRLSETTHKTTLYFATADTDGYVVRSAMTMKRIKGFEAVYFRYYIMIMLACIGLSLVLVTKLSDSISRPIRRLQKITASIADGNLEKRVSINRNDEIGQLAETFNNMAEKLQYTLNDSINQSNKLKAILTSMDSGVIAIDTGYKIIMINPYAREIFGIDSDIIGKNLMDSIRDFELEEIFKYGNGKYHEITIIWPRKRQLRIKTADIINNFKDKIGTVAVVQDITDIKRLENMRSEFVANVSHELKTPLTSIKGFAETLKYVDNSENKNKFLNIINDEADRLTRLIEDILILSHIENDNDDSNDRINIKSIIQDVCCLMEGTAKKKNINIAMDVSSLPDIYGNKDKFKQMMINLIDNAVKYSNKDGFVEVGDRLVNEDCIIWVKDNGVGISKEHKERLFERFYRVDKARSRSQGGTGLGLAIVKHIVMGFKGSIEVESEVGIGSKFIVKIPVSKQD